jgi:alpha-L-rhamnosidase
VVDNRELALGYPLLITDGGAGASATPTYAETLFDAAGRKGDRNEIEGKTIRGVRDRLRFDGRNQSRGLECRRLPEWPETLRPMTS